jgi:hypothetical protein
VEASEKQGGLVSRKYIIVVEGKFRRIRA